MYRAYVFPVLRAFTALRYPHPDSDVWTLSVTSHHRLPQAVSPVGQVASQISWQAVIAEGGLPLHLRDYHHLSGLSGYVGTTRQADRVVTPSGGYVPLLTSAIIFLRQRARQAADQAAPATEMQKKCSVGAITDTEAMQLRRRAAHIASRSILLRWSVAV